MVFSAVKKTDGSWRVADQDFHPNEWGFEYSQGNPYHYLAAANHDPEGVIQLHGGPSAFREKLEAVFAAPKTNILGSNGSKPHAMLEMESVDLGQYAHANQPVHNMIYMFNYAGAPSRTAYHVRKVLDETTGQYTPGVADGGGFVGDEDNGSMSSWYVFSALGFFPASPGHPQYALGSPLFPLTKLHLADGRTFTIRSSGVSTKNIFIQRAFLNGIPYNRNYLEHADLMAGGELVLEMGEMPSPEWDQTLVPSSMSPLGVTLPRAKEISDEAMTGKSDHSELFDNNSLTKVPGIPGDAVFSLSWTLPKKVDSITLTTDSPGTAPRRFRLEASLDGENWSVVTTQDDIQWTWNQELRVFAIQNPGAFSYYRLILPREGNPETMALAEWELFSDG